MTKFLEIDEITIKYNNKIYLIDIYFFNLKYYNLVRK